MPAPPTEPVHHGRCLCGAVCFVAAGAPLWVAYCHCRSCQRQTGAPVSLYAGFADSRVSFPTLPPTVRASSPGVQRGFCPHCGTPLSYAAPARWPGEIHLFVATFDDPGAFRPSKHGSWHERLPGFDVADDLPRG